MSSINPYEPPAAELDATAAAPAPRQPSWSDGPQGIGGWLLLPLLGLIVSPFRLGWSLMNDLAPVFTGDTWAALTVPGAQAYHPLWAPYLVFEMLANLGVMLFGLYALWSFLRKSRRTPRLMVTWFALLVVVQLVDHFVGQMIPAVANQTGQGQTQEVGRSIFAAILWIPYFLKSQRVANTFVR